MRGKCEISFDVNTGDEDGSGSIIYGDTLWIYIDIVLNSSLLNKLKFNGRRVIENIFYKNLKQMSL